MKQRIVDAVLWVVTMLAVLSLTTGCSTLRYLNDNGVERERVRQRANQQIAGHDASARIGVAQADRDARIGVAVEQTNQVHARETGETDRFFALQLTTLAQINANQQIFFTVVVALFAIMFLGLIVGAFLFLRFREQPVSQSLPLIGDIEWLGSMPIRDYLADRTGANVYGQAGWYMVRKTNNDEDLYLRRDLITGGTQMMRLLAERKTDENIS